MDADDLVLERIEGWIAAYDQAAISVADLFCDRHAGSGRVAVFTEDAAGTGRRLTYAELHDHSMRFAGVLRGLGIGKGDRVATLLPKTPDLVIAVLAIWRIGAVHIPLFTAFGPQAIAYRLEQSRTSALVTDAVNRSKVGTLQGVTPKFITIERDGGTLQPGDIGFWSALRKADPVPGAELLSGDDPMILTYTSGTTGHPKRVSVPVKALAAIRTYMHFGLDLRGDDVYWNAADPGWAYGLYYALIGPLLLGQS